MSASEKPGHSPINSDQAKSLGIGRIEISDQVIAAIATQAAKKVDGVSVVGSTFRWTGLSRKGGVSVKTDEESGHVVVEVEIDVRYGITIYEAAHALQHLIKDEVETMTGAMNVDKVNIRVREMVLDDQEDKPIVSPDKAVDEAFMDNEDL